MCVGCMYLTLIGNSKCAFCNAKIEANDIGNDIKMERLKKRAEANDANIITYLGHLYAKGSLRQDYNKAFELWTRGAELGSSKAHF